MKNFQALVSLAISVTLVVSCLSFTLSASAISPSSAAIYSTNSLRFEGSGKVKGDAIITAGNLSGSNNPWSTGSIYKTANVTIKDNYPVNQSIIKDYDGSLATYTLPSYNAFPSAAFFTGKGTYTDGTKDITVGWSGGEVATNYTISADSFIDKLLIRNTLNLNINVASGDVRVLRINTLENQGSITIVGGGRVILYVGTITTSGSSYFNSNGSQDNMAIFISQNDTTALFDNTTIHANIFVPYSNAAINNTEIAGNVYVGETFKMTNSGNIVGLVLAPNSYSTIDNATYIIGKLITDGATLAGSGYVEAGGTRSLPSDISDFIGAEDATPTTTVSTTIATTTPVTTATEATTAPTTIPSTTAVTPTAPVKMVTITAVVARRMSIRLESGQILKSGDKFTMPEGGIVKFQMCTNNWDTDRYTDSGEGIAGTKVFEYTYVKHTEKYLRVDTDKFFQVVKFHFAKGDYKKLTGVDQVLSTPLESLSINFPLGATIKVDAYVKNAVIETKYLYIDSSVYNYTWNY